MDVSLVEARTAATALRSRVRDGSDPVAERRKARKVIPSFETATRDCYDALKEGWKNRRYARTGSPASKTTCSRTSAPSRSIKVDSACVVEVLSPIWLEIPETARRLLQRIGAVLDFAHIKGWRAGRGFVAFGAQGPAASDGESACTWKPCPMPRCRR
jgi:hypothetical protein